MRAALLMSPSKIEIYEIAEPAVREGEVLIQPIRVGICGTDISFYLGHRPAITYPFVLGHELVGRIAAIGDQVDGFRTGQRVVVEPNYPCGTCSLCLSGRGNICAKKQSMGVTVAGCFADYVTAPAKFVWSLPDSISDSDAACIEPLTVSLHALLQSGAMIGDTVAVLGCGVIGLLLIHAAVRQGINVLAHDKTESKLEFATRLGAVACQSNELKDLWQKKSVSTLFECAGANAAVELALGSVPRGARVVLLGLSSSSASFMPLRLVREGIRVEGSMIYDHPADFARSIALVEKGILCPSCIVNDTFQFSLMATAMEFASDGNAAKVHALMA
ncbi:MAG: zinc-dependent alcohol dehydrogenase [Candidatus Acidiferrales bacterium]